MAPGSTTRRPATAFDLANGMRFIVAEDHAAPVVAAGFWVRAGVCDEPDDRRGIAHFMEHMMFRGSENVGSEEHSRRIERLGGDANAWTSFDATVYHDTVPSSALDQVFRLEADRFQRLALTGEHIDVECKVVVEEVHVYNNQPFVKAFRMVLEAVAQGHPYALGPLGREEDVSNVSTDDLEAFHRKCYRPDNVYAVVVGDVNGQRVEELAERHFASWRPEGGRPQTVPVPPLVTRTGELSLRVPLQVPVTVRVHRVPSPDEVDRPALELLDRLLASGRTSLIREALVEKGRLCVGAGALLQKLLHGGVLAVFGASMPPVNHGRRRRVMREICDRIAGEGPDPDRFARCIKQARRARVLQEYDVPERMRLLGTAELLTEGFETYARELDELAAVTPERVRELAAEVFAPANTLELDITPEHMPWWMWPAGLLSRMLKR